MPDFVFEKHSPEARKRLSAIKRLIKRILPEFEVASPPLKGQTDRLLELCRSPMAVPGCAS
jgi:hypothetical protein